MQQVEELTSGESVHISANLLGAYRAAYKGYAETCDEEYFLIAVQAERELRILLHELRKKRAVFISWE